MCACFWRILQHVNPVLDKGSPLTGHPQSKTKMTGLDDSAHRASRRSFSVGRSPPWVRATCACVAGLMDGLALACLLPLLFAVRGKMQDADYSRML